MKGESEVLDLELLDRQTLGDRELAQDLFRLFDAQCDRLWPVIAHSPDQRARSDAAHTLKGGAAAIGATRVMRLAGELEDALDGEGEGGATGLLPGLEQAIDAARRAIRALQGPS